MVEKKYENSPQRLMDVGPEIDVHIGFDKEYKLGKSNIDISGELYPALIDTGADYSGINSELARRLKIPVVDRMKVYGIEGEVESDKYDAQIVIPSLSFVIPGHFYGFNNSDRQTHLAIIGRVFLRHLKMVYDGPTGNFTLSVPD